jgi:hypothetical protein
VLELESDLQTATTGLATTSRQLSQVTNQLQAATEEASWLQDSNAKLSQDLEGKSNDPPVLVRFCVCFLSELDLVTMVAVPRMIRAGMVARLATVKQERNTAVLKVIEKDGVCRCLNHSTSMGGTRSKVEGEDRHDLEPEGTREDTRHEIYTGSGSRSSYPTSCLE